MLRDTNIVQTSPTYISARIVLINKDWLVCVALDKHYVANINYVHQLQHLLFGLGLNYEMEV